jgi:hypothetical protein
MDVRKVLNVIQGSDLARRSAANRSTRIPRTTATEAGSRHSVEVSLAPSGDRTKRQALG